jgi:non-ribosomal peptide synthetase component E (peptide arylation enzyme)
MSIDDIVPMVSSLSNAEKFKLMQIILSQLAREQETPVKDSTSGQQDSLFDIIGMAEGENTDVGRRHDDYLYGTP